MKWIKRIFLGIILLLLLASLWLVVSGNEHLFKGVANTYLVGRTGPSIDEYAIFDNRSVKAGNSVEWPKSLYYNSIELSDDATAKIEAFEPVAFAIFHRDSVLYERYWPGYTENSQTNSFSMAKTIVGILTCMAIDEGKITSVDDPVGKYLPEFKEGKNGELTIRHLLTMTSAMNFDESYGDPFGFMAKAYYGDELKEKTLGYEVTGKPGSEFHYLGGNTILLSLILSEVTGTTMSEYCSQKLWHPIGAKNDALWNLDDEGGIEKAYCCFYSNARDFAKIGQLFLHQGNVNGQQLLDSQLVEQATQPAKYSDGNLIEHYGWHWWVGEDEGMKFYYARGILGQYIIIVPEMDMVIVRLGHKRSDERIGKHIKDVFDYIDIGKEMAKKSGN